MTLKLADIPVDKVWTTKDSSLFFHLHLAEHKMITLRAKKTLASLVDRIYIDEDLTWIQSQELATVWKVMIEARKLGKWATIHRCRVVIRDSPPRTWGGSWPSKNFSSK